MKRLALVAVLAMFASAGGEASANFLDLDRTEAQSDSVAKGASPELVYVVGQAPSGNPDNNRADNWIKVYVRATRQLVRATRFPFPSGLVLSEDGRFLYALSLFDNEGDPRLADLVVMDAATLTVVDRLVDVHRTPRGPLALSRDGRTLFLPVLASTAGGYFGELLVLDADTLTIQASVPFTGDPRDITLCGLGGSNVCVATGPAMGQVVVIDPSARAVVASTPIGQTPIDIETSPDEQELWVTNFNSQSISVIDASTYRPMRTISVPGHPWEGEFLPDGTRAFVSLDLRDEVAVIETATHDLTHLIPVERQSRPIGVATDGSEVWIGNFASSSITIIDAASSRPIDRISTDIQPYQILMSRALSADDMIARLLDRIDQLAQDGMLRPPRAAEFQQRIGNAQRKLQEGRPDVAARQLTAFLHQLEGLRKAGELTSSVAEELAARVSQILSALD